MFYQHTVNMPGFFPLNVVTALLIVPFGLYMAGGFPYTCTLDKGESLH